MTLVVDVPPGYEKQRRYILDVVLADWLGLPWQLQVRDRNDVRIRLEESPDDVGVIVPDVLFSTPTPEWLTAVSLPSTPLPAFAPTDRPGKSPPGQRRLPIIYGRPAIGGPRAPDEIRLTVDVFGSAFFMLTRYEEAVVSERDHYHRFPARASLAHREGFLTVPVVDAYVELLWDALSRRWPRLRRRERHYQVFLSHDVDDPLASLGRRGVDFGRQFAADLAIRRDFRLAGRRARSLLSRRPGHASDPHNNFDFLMDVSERSGLTSAFYFQSHDRPDIGSGANYAVDHPWIRGLLRRVHDRGHEVGYHAGFGTYLDPHLTALEFERLRRVAEREGVRQDLWGGRQHYLQWAVSTTWSSWDAAGLGYDSSVAYADAVGFRTGTCHEYRVFDLSTGTRLDLRERPFQVMDVTLFGYMSLNREEALDVAVRIAAECRSYGGSLGVLWHNDSLLRTDREKRWYIALVDAVKAPAVSR